MYSIMKKLIEKKYYSTEEEILTKLDIFFATNRLLNEEYVELVENAHTVYADVVSSKEKDEALTVLGVKVNG